MEKKQFKTTIDASREKVWTTLWSDETYPEWTAIFGAGSRAETDWKKGSKVLFLGGDGNEGMVSMIAESIPGEFMSFKHLGMVKNGVEDIESAQAKGWYGALENYTLKTIDGKTELTVDMDMTEEHKDFFIKTWPKALDKLREIAEKK